MKRVQALVSGKKKQCTKLPTPSSPQPVKGKKKSSSTSPPSGFPEGITTTTTITLTTNDKKGKPVVTSPKDAAAATTTHASGGGHVAPSAAPTVNALTTASAKETSSSSSSPPATTTTTTSVAKESPENRTASRIPASSPKKNRDATTTPSGKGRLRLESEEKPKKKPSLIRRLSLKDKQKTDGRSRSKSDPPSDQASDAGASSTGYISSGGEESSRSRTISQREAEVGSQVSVSTRSSDSRTITPQPSQSQMSEASSSSLHRRGSDSTLGKEDREEEKPPNENNNNNVSVLEKDRNIVPSHAKPPANGHQKSNGPPAMTSSTTPVNGHQHHHHHHSAGATSTEHLYANVTRNRPGSLPMPRDAAARYQTGQSQQQQQQRPTTMSRDHGRPNGAPMMPPYGHGYASLPRSSRATTPTAEDIYSYGTLPRRMNSTGGAPGQSMAYQNNIYGTVGPASSWGTLSRESSSDSGFNLPPSHDERGRRPAPSAGSRNVNGNYNNTAGHPSDYHRYPRAGSVPPPGSEVPESIYSLARPDSVPPVYYSDGEYGRFQISRGMRAGSVPLGYESESSAYIEGRNRGPSRNYESDTGNDDRAAAGLRVQPGDEQYRAGPGKRPVPRRHTLGASNKDRKPNSETERKREAFMNLLAQRYPQYADRIQGSSSGTSTPNPQHQHQQQQQQQHHQQQQQQQHQQQQRQAPIPKPARSREPQRRRTAVVSYDPAHATNTLEYDDLGTMSDLELPSFQRGNYMRTSLPIVRSASTSLDRPLGLIFLVYGEQTKKSLLPNEITTLDTVRALFVRAFTNLTMEMLEEKRKKIYILDKSTNIYFQLEDLVEIVDRSVLKLHDTDNDEPQRVRERQEVRGRTVQMPLSRPQSRQGHAPDNSDFSKAHSLPPQASPDYPEIMQDQRHPYDVERERRSRSRTPEPTERPRYSHSPDRLPTPERGPLNPIPENRQLTPGYREPGNNYYESVGPPSPATHNRSQYPSGTYEAPATGQYQAYPVAGHAPPQQAYLARNTRAPNMMHHPQRPMGPVYGGSNSIRHSQPFATTPMAQVDTTYQRSQSYRNIPAERDQEYVRSISAAPPSDHKTKNRIEKMEAQLANLTAWVHYQKSDPQQRKELPRGPRSLGSTASDSSDTFPASSASSLSDIPDGQRPSLTSLRDSPPRSIPAEINSKLSQLKHELHTLKRQQQLNMEAMREEFMSALSKIKSMCSSVPGAENQVNFHNRTEMTERRKSYLQNKEQVTLELHDLESTVEELRNDVISRKCRVNISDVEGMALLLSNITKNLADLKAQFPELQETMKTVMDSEMTVVVSEEKFLNEEPVEIEGCLKRCKKLTETLYTLKRLASVQDHRPPHIPNVNCADDGMADQDQKKMLLENICAIVPDHGQRVQHMEAADASRERKKKISVQQEALKFGKTLEIASKALRPPSTGEDIAAAYPEEETTDGKVKYKSSTFQNDVQIPHRSKSPVTIKSVSSAATHPPVYSHPITSTVSTGIATHVTVTSSLATSKPSFSSTLTSSSSSLSSSSSSKPTPTDKESAFSSTNQIQQMYSKPSHSQPISSISGTRSATLPLTSTTERLSGHVHGGTGPVSPTVTTSEANRRTQPPTSDRPALYSKPSTMGALMRREKNERIAPLAGKEELVDSGRGRPKSSPTPPTLSGNPRVLMSAKSFDEDYQKRAEANGDINGHSNNEVKQANPPPTYASLTSPSKSSPTSSSPARNVTDNGGSVATVTPSGTINLILSGSVSPKSPTDPGTFTISPPAEIMSPSAKVDPNPSHIPSTPIKHDGSLSDDNASISGSPAHGDTKAKQKKVPPPPPPRKGSRPTSMSGLPTANGGLNHSQQPQDTPQFVGGILGQHRLSGGPLSSTPKVSSSSQPPRAMSTFEKDIASGIYANLNRPDLQSQTSSPQQMINQVHSSPAHNRTGEDLPPTPVVTSSTIDREERGSSSESTSSSSGTSMGSQQSVVNIARSARTGSLNIKTTKPKPEPPRRQSSLFSKQSHNRDTLVHDRKKTLNGVDL